MIGRMTNFWQAVNKVIRNADILIEVVDARAIDESRNKEIEDKVMRSGKTLIYVVNKCDLTEKQKLEEAKERLFPCVFVSAKQKLGTSMLRREIMKQAAKKKLKDRFTVGILGYPNTGKSSIINLLKGRAAASTAPVSGHTKGIQLIRVSTSMYLIDTPGVFPYGEKDEKKHAIIAAKTFSNLKDPEATAMELVETYSEQICDYYHIKNNEDSEIVLENLARKLKRLRKGGLPDTNAAARRVLTDWQEGKIGSR
jgi:ribosome biogenesis GTPase A